jgi:DNA-binding transcriptional LysR family regulator
VGRGAGQVVLTVPSLEAIVAGLVGGVGVGFPPRPTAARAAAAGRLRILAVEHPRTPTEMLLAWRPGAAGKALRWFVRHLESAEVAMSLLP